ncbi:MAG: hypothetical protein RL673_685, partial [Actinomycetota bacterium]
MLEGANEAMSETVNVSTTVWFITLGIVSLVILLDLAWAVYRRNSITSLREAASWTAIYVSAAIIFGISMRSWDSPKASGEFFAGWITEYSLSIDNLFVFLIILTRLKVEKQKEQLVLLLGIVMALVMRGIITEDPDEDEWQENRVIQALRKRGYSTFTIALVAVGTTDLLFALDSIPAIFGLTRDPYIVFMANAFALMGLRQLYFLVGILLKRLVYLSKGLSIVLGFIGVKLVIEALHG